MAEEPKRQPLDVFIFYAPWCPRCKVMHSKVRKAQSSLMKLGFKKTDFRFIWMNTDKPTVQTIMRKKYPCVNRIPAVVALNDIYWVGAPDDKDFSGVLAYLADNPEGGKGAYG